MAVNIFVLITTTHTLANAMTDLYWGKMGKHAEVSSLWIKGENSFPFYLEIIQWFIVVRAEYCPL